jgi:hypothetical protein
VHTVAAVVAGVVATAVAVAVISVVVIAAVVAFVAVAAVAAEAESFANGPAWFHRIWDHLIDLQYYTFVLHTTGELLVVEIDHSNQQMTLVLSSAHQPE